MRPESHWRRLSGAVDEARLAVCAQHLTTMLNEQKLAVLIRQHGIGKPKDREVQTKLLTAFALAKFARAVSFVGAKFVREAVFGD